LGVDVSNADIGAFPSAGIFDSKTGPHGASSGLTKLEYFAAAALQGICAADTEDQGKPKMMVEHAVNMARLLIAELERPQ